MVQSTGQHQCNGVCPNPSLDIQDGTQIYSWSRRQRQQVGACSPWFRAQGFPGSGTAQLNRKTKWWWIGGNYPAWREAKPTENSIDLPVETQMELGRCGDQDALTNLTRSINPQSDLNVWTQGPPSFVLNILYALCVSSPIPKAHALMYLPSYVRNIRTLPIPFWNYLWYMSWGKNRFFYFRYSKISPLFLHRLILFSHPRFKQFSLVGRKEGKLKINNLRWFLCKTTSFIYAPAKMGWNGYYISQWPLLLYSGTGDSPTPRCPIAPSLANSSESLFVLALLQLHCCWVIL